MSDQLVSITRKEKIALELKSKAGWRAYYLMRDNFDNMCEQFHTTATINNKLRSAIMNQEDINIDHLKSQFVELYGSLKKYSECPVCYEVLTKEILEVPKCVHLICRGCKDTICESNSLCPICKKKF